MTTTAQGPERDVRELDRVTIRFAGDSGDGMQLTGTQFTRGAALFGNDIATPAEAREMLSMPPLDHAAVNKALAAVTIEQLEAAKASLSELSKVYTPVQSGMGGKK